MIRVTRVRRLEPIGLSDAFDYVVDFDHIGEWDPGVARSRRLDGASLEIGSRHEVDSVFFGRQLPLVYELTESAPPDRAILKTTSRRFDATDTIELTAAGSTATTIRYSVEFRFKGIMRLAEPFMGRALSRVVEKALDGLQATIAARSETTQVEGE